MGRNSLLAVLITLYLVQPALSQSTNATVSGTIEDISQALLPGVTVTATNNATGIVTTVVSNEAGAYNFPSLLPGVYEVRAELPSFQTRSYTDVRLGNAERIRLNFVLAVGGVDTAVEVTVAADTLLATASSSVGEVLSEQKVQQMPMVGNNVLDLFRLLPGARMNADGVNGTFAGVDASKVNIQRDGVDASGSAYWVQAGAQSATFINPDLVGEMRMILAPVDAEFGRGNAQVQFLTRSGTNLFRGSAVWSARNTALDANTWNNNNNVDPRTGAWKPTKPDWVNAHQYTASLGGPLVRNKTFFFALLDGLIVNSRTNQNPVVLTPCARNGIFRYFDNWNNGNAIEPTQAGNTPTVAVVDAVGNPLRPAVNPNGTPYTGQLRYASVFGRLMNVPSRPDCSDAQVQADTAWDPFRTRQDPSGYVAKVLNTMPAPNNYETGDGLNTAGYRWTRSERGGREGIFAFGGNLGRKQLNTKIDHNFNTAHKIGVSYTYEQSSGNSTGFETLPGGFRGRVERRPQTLSANFTSTLSPSVLNEARLGYRRTAGKSYNALNNPETSAEALAFYPSFNGYPVVVAPGVGQMNFQNYPGSNSSSSYFDTTTLWTYADSISWTTGRHAFKAGAEIRRGHSAGYDAGIGITSIPRATGGDAPLAAIPSGAIGSSNMPGLAGTTTSGNNARMRNLLSFLAGSLGSVTQLRFMQDPTKLSAFEDYKTFPQRARDMHNQNETSVFFKDDWKAHKDLTLNLGIRWAYFAVPYESHGLMPLPVGGGNGIWGYSGRSWDGWMQPGQRGDLMTIEFVGKNSPNPNQTWYPNDYSNFGPAVGFAWQLPWFGAGKTTIRGGYQMTYQLNQSGNNIIQEINVPGASDGYTYIPSSADPYLDLTRLSSLIPVPSTLRPLETVPVTARISQIYVPDPGLETPYAQNLTLSFTRSVRSNLTIDVRYIGTLARKQWNPQVNINQPNFLYNGLKEAFDAARAGDDHNPSLQVLENMFRGINVGGSGYGPVGSTFNGVLQTAGMHMRASTGTSGGVAGNLRANLANGNYANVAAILNTLNYATAFNRSLPVIPAGVQGAVLRHNGLPENFIRANPQLGAAAYLLTTLYSNNYHSAEAQVTLRPTHGISLQSTYTWSKNLGVGQAGGLGATYTTMADRHADYSLQSDTRIHDFRTNGVFELPIGPSKLLAGNSSGTMARLIEGWQLGWIVNINSGQPMSIAAQNMLYALGTPDIVGPFDTKAGKVTFQQNQSGSYLPAGAFRAVPDPQCGRVTTLQGLQGQCTIDAVADAQTGQILLQNPLPGSRGTLGQRLLEGPGQWRFDANLRKMVRIGENRSLEFRVDARNVLNHPEPADPVLDINNANFGRIVGTQGNAKSTLHREFQAQLRFNF
jgi:hypothetical protein